MLAKLKSSVLAKLIAIYIIIAFLLVGVLGLTITGACKQELLKIRFRQLNEKAVSVGLMLMQTGISEQQLLYSGVLQSIAQEHDAVLQIAHSDGCIFAEYDGRAAGAMKDGKYIDTAAMNAISAGKVYSRMDYRNENGESTSTVTVGITSIEGELKYIVAIHASDASVDNAYLRILGKFWIPCVVIVGLCIVLILLLNYSITTPLVEMNSVAKEISRGNYSKHVLVTSSDEVGQLAQSFNAMADELEKTDTMRKDFIANISHELRTPLTSINGFVQGILDGTIPASEQRRYLEIVLAESQRLSRLTREMLDLSRIESGKYKISKAVFDINELLRRVIITLGDKLEEKEIDFVADFKEERICVAADAGCIEQVCVNLMDNAIKFTDKGKNITVTSEIVGGKARITIADEGKGISKEDLAHIWDRFYTENKSRSGNSGMGLGLSIVKRLLAEHGEDINVESEPGKGTAFSFELELAPKGSGAMKL